MAETITAHLKDAAWSGLEVGAAIIGAVATTKWLDEQKLFKKEFASNPEWFNTNRDGAPFKIKYFPGMVAGGALFAATYAKNPWLKMALFGVAFAGGVKQLRILTWDKKKGDYKIKQIGDTAIEHDKALKEMAENYRQTHVMEGPEYLSGEEGMSRPEYVEGQDHYGDRYESAIAAAVRKMYPQMAENYGNRYESSIAKGIYDEDEWPSDMKGAFSLEGADMTEAA